MSEQQSSRPFQLLGHAINHIQDCIEAGNDQFSILITKELAADDCFQTVLAGFLEDSAYSFDESVESNTVANLKFSRRENS